MSDEHVAAQKLREAFPEAVEEVTTFRDETTVVIRKADLLAAAGLLKEDPDLAFDFLTMVCAVDLLPREPRYEVVYQLYSIRHRHRFRVKTRLSAEDPVVDSVTSLWPTANWHEREAYDLMGIRFQDHPDLRRILLPEDWQGHPLRKDYPLKGPDRAA